MLIDYIPRGAERAITAKELAKKAGFTAVRDLQDKIHDLRVKGTVICSKTDYPAGYYIPDTKEELEHFCKSMQSRAYKINLAVKTAEMMLQQIDEQDNKKSSTCFGQSRYYEEKYESGQA